MNNCFFTPGNNPWKRKKRADGKPGTMEVLCNDGGVEVAWVYRDLDTKSGYILEALYEDRKIPYDRAWEAKKAGRFYEWRYKGFAPDTADWSLDDWYRNSWLYCEDYYEEGYDVFIETWDKDTWYDFIRECWAKDESPNDRLDALVGGENYEIMKGCEFELVPDEVPPTNYEMEF